MVEMDSPDVVHMAFKNKETFLFLVIPDSDLLIITSRAKERLGLMEVYSSNRPFVLVEFVNQDPDSVVKHLDVTGVK